MPKLKSNVLVVEVNGKQQAVIGVRHHGNGSVIVGFRSYDQKSKDLLQYVVAGALEVDRRKTYRHVEYLESTQLAVGDIVTIRVAKSEKLSKPKSSKTETIRQRKRAHARYAARNA
jgi:hypothetical protein